MTDLASGVRQIADPANGEAPAAPRRRGRPPRAITTDAVVDAVQRLFAEGGIEAVTIERAAAELTVSRATLYRSVPSKKDLLGLLFTRMNRELTAAAREASQAPDRTAGERLEALIGVQVEASVRMRDYLFVFIDGSRIPTGDYDEWRRWLEDYEQIWLDAVANAIAAGDLPPGDVRLTTRLILGMTIWVARWFRPRENVTPEQIQQRTLEILGLVRTQTGDDKGPVTG
jgi:AcrR family transcriptional regulator